MSSSSGTKSSVGLEATSEVVVAKGPYLASAGAVVTNRGHTKRGKCHALRLKIRLTRRASARISRGTNNQSEDPNAPIKGLDL